MKRKGPVRIALVGAGYAARVQLEAYRLIDEAQVVAIANRTRERADGLAREFGIPRVATELETLLAEGGFDAVDITTAAETHAAFVLAAAQRGYHILCQKPFATTMEDARRMVDACREGGVRLMVNENWRWRVWYQTARAVLDAGRLGKVHYFRLEQRRPVVLPTGEGDTSPWLIRQPFFVDAPQLVLLEMGTHLVDVARFLFGDLKLEHAELRKVTPYVRGEELASLTLASGDGFGQVELNWAAHGLPQEPNWDAMLVEGEKATMVLDHTGSLRITSAGGQETISPETSGYYLQSWAAAQRHFVQCLLSGEPFQTSGEDNLKTLAPVLEGYLRSGYLRS